AEALHQGDEHVDLFRGDYGGRVLHLEGADVRSVATGGIRHNGIFNGARKSSAALVGGRTAEVLALVNGRAASHRRLGEGRAAVVLQRAEHRIGVDLVA